MATPGSDFDITLNAVGFMLDKDENGLLRFYEGRTEVLRPLIGNTALDTDPLDRYVIAHYDTFEGGFGESLHEPQQPITYGASNGAYMLAPNRIGPASKIYHLGFGISDPGAEEASTPWTNTNATNTATLSVANSYEGEYHWLFATSIAAGISYRTLANPTALQSASLTFHGMGRMVTTQANHAVRLFIWDDVTGYTYSSAVSAADYASMSATATINAAATVVRVGITDNGTALTLASARVDALAITSAGTDTPVGFATDASNLYTAAGRFVYQWDETNDKFDVVKVLAGNATSICEFGGNIYVGVGTSVAFWYGTTTSWTQSTLSGNSKYATHFVRSMDRAGNVVLWSTFQNQSVRVSTNPVNGGTDWTVYTVGDSSVTLTGLYTWNRTIVVGKEDGLYIFSAIYFSNLTTEKLAAPSTDNFAKGFDFQGVLYLSGAQGALYRLSLGSLQGPLSAVHMRGYEYGPDGKVGAFGTDGSSLLVGISQRNVTTTSWILQSNDGRTFHTLYDLAAPDTTQWAVTSMDTHFEEMASIHAIGTFNGYTYVAGYRVTLPHAEVMRWVLPTTTEAPYRDTSPDPQPKYYLRLPRMTGSFPNDTKSFADVTIGSRNLSAGNRLANVYYRVDNGSWTSLGSATTSPKHTLTFSSVNGKELELIIEVDGQTSSAITEILPITVTGTIRPTRKRRYTLFVQLGRDVPHLGDIAVDTADAEAKYTSLRSAETTANPVTLTFIRDFSIGSQPTTSVSVHIRNVELERIIPGETGYRSIYRVDCVEA